eukprot:TRINITY_DN4488_c0_g1_i8.p1 TRINITY_DN4488_c0_g1~~TRINITY_DN4488_c0_g1_i8.p1  ORF type:complete len:182 (+),score=31.19 TRINITY_DN4488_c0_g1_i8:117-662(+)
MQWQRKVTARYFDPTFPPPPSHKAGNGLRERRSEENPEKNKEQLVKAIESLKKDNAALAQENAKLRQYNEAIDTKYRDKLSELEHLRDSIQRLQNKIGKMTVRAEARARASVAGDSSLTREEMMQLMLLHEQDLRDQMEKDKNEINPDKMTYEELLELEEQMGKVSKGLNIRQIQVINCIT